MDFLSICQRVNKLSGLHGSMTSVDSTRDLQLQISNGVNESWTFLQNYRKDWTFMIKQHNFTCYQGNEVYIPYSANPYSPGNPSGDYTVGIEDLGTYKRDSLFLENRKIPYISSATYPYIDNTNESQPAWWTVEPRTNDLYLDLPDDDYEFVIYYRKKIQDLFSGLTPNTNVPELPENYHNILIYAGLSAFATYIGNSELFMKYTLMYDQMLGDLMREYLPSKRIKTRSII